MTELDREDYLLSVCLSVEGQVTQLIPEGCEVGKSMSCRPCNISNVQYFAGFYLGYCETVFGPNKDLCNLLLLIQQPFLAQ